MGVLGVFPAFLSIGWGGVNNEREGRKSEEREKEERQRQRSLP